jgi:hypothetical protein
LALAAVGMDESIHKPQISLLNIWTGSASWWLNSWFKG